MSQIFHPAMNTLSQAMVFGRLFLIVVLAFAWDQLNRSDYLTGADVVRNQPVPFSHEHEVGCLGMQYRDCFKSFETSAFAVL